MKKLLFHMVQLGSLNPVYPSPEQALAREAIRKGPPQMPASFARSQGRPPLVQAVSP